MSPYIVWIFCGLAIVATGKPTREKRLALSDRHWKWPNGIIPYEIVNVTKRMELAFEEAVGLINNVSCVRWIHKTDTVAAAQYRNQVELDMFTVRVYGFDQGYDRNNRILLGDATLGRSSYPRIRLNVGEWWRRGWHYDVVKSTVLHEMMHVMGFAHEHERSDAHHHVYVPQQINHNSLLTYNLPFDYESVMLYWDIGAIDKRERTNNGTFSKQDILIMNIYFECYPKEQKICKSIDHTNLRHFIPDGEIGKFSQFDAKFNDILNWTNTDTIRVGERCVAPNLEPGCLVETIDESGTVKTRFAKNGCWIERNGKAVQCDLQNYDGIKFPLSEDDKSKEDCFINL